MDAPLSPEILGRNNAAVLALLDAALAVPGGSSLHLWAVDFDESLPAAIEAWGLDNCTAHKLTLEHTNTAHPNMGGRIRSMTLKRAGRMFVHVQWPLVEVQPGDPCLECDGAGEFDNTIYGARRVPGGDTIACRYCHGTGLHGAESCDDTHVVVSVAEAR